MLLVHYRRQTLNQSNFCDVGRHRIEKSRYVNIKVVSVINQVGLVSALMPCNSIAEVCRMADISRNQAVAWRVGREYIHRVSLGWRIVHIALSEPIPHAVEIIRVSPKRRYRRHS